MNDFNILDAETEKRRKKTIVTTILICVGVLAIAGLFIFGAWKFGLLNRGNNNDNPVIIDSQKPTEEDRSKYELDKKIYDDEGIDYSYEDWKKDQELIDGSDNNNSENPSNPERQTPSDGVSSAKQKLNDKVNDELKEISEFTGIDIDIDELKTSIEKQVQAKIDFVNSHYGWPVGDYGSEYDEVRDYIDSIHNTFAHPNAELSIGGQTGIYGESISQLQNELRFMLYHEQQYYTGYANCPTYNIMYKNWLNMGLPNIGKISSLNIEFLNPVESFTEANGNFYTISLKAKVSTSNGIFIIYLSDMDVMNDKAEMVREYVIIDIERGE